MCTTSRTRVVYLSAPSGKFVTGEVLMVDGGNQQWGDVWPAGMPDYFRVGDLRRA